MKYKFRLIEQMLTEGTKYDKLAANIISNSGLFDEETSNNIIQALFREDIHAFTHSPSWLEKYLKGIARMLVDYANGNQSTAQSFLSECPAVFDEYLTWIKENRTEENKNKLDSNFIDKMSYQDVKDFLDELQAERDKESKDKLSQMKFNQSNFSLVPINSYEEMHSKYGGRATGDGSSDKYAGGGGTAWCHTNNEGVYNGWTQGGNKFFVLQNNNWKDIPFDRESNKENPKDAYGNSLIALLVDKRHGTLKRATLRCNHVGVNSNADNQYKTYAELSEVAGFNVEEEVAKYIDVKPGGVIELDPSEVVSVDLLSIKQAELLSGEIRAYSGWWWLQSPSRTGSLTRVAGVYSGGSVSPTGAEVGFDERAVRPAINIITESDLNYGDVVSVFGYRWVCFSDLGGRDLALLAPDEEPLTVMPFSEYKNNDYRFSGIKHWLDDWFKRQTGRKSATESPYFISDDMKDYIEEDDIKALVLIDTIDAENIPTSILKYSDDWWLRSRGDANILVANVYKGGRIDDGGDMVMVDKAVRPALWIRGLDGLYPDIGDVIMIQNRPWAYIGNDKVLLVGEPLAKGAFNTEPDNNYGTSHIKAYLDSLFLNWFGKENWG